MNKPLKQRQRGRSNRPKMLANTAGIKYKMSDLEYYKTAEKIAKDNWKSWKKYEPSMTEDVALTRVLNDNEYDYRGFYDKYPYSNANAETHWTDEFKGANHPTFSRESKYSGQYDPNWNPGAIHGGEWTLGPAQHVPSFEQRTGTSIIPRYEYGTPPKGKITDKQGLYDHATGLYQEFINQGIDPQVALELTNLKIAEGGWNFPYWTGDGKKFNDLSEFVKHIKDWHGRMYPYSLKAKNFEEFYNGINDLRLVKYKYNSENPNYKLWLLLTRPGVKRRINDYRKTFGQEPLAYLNNNMIYA